MIYVHAVCDFRHFQKYGFPKGMLRNVTCIRVIAILTLIRQLCKPILHESKIKLHEFRANKQTFFSHITKYPLRKLEVFICQIREEIRNPLTIVSYLLIKAAQDRLSSPQ